MCLPESRFVYLPNKRTKNAFSVLFIGSFESKGKFQPASFALSLFNKTFTVWIPSYCCLIEILVECLFTVCSSEFFALE